MQSTPVPGPVLEPSCPEHYIDLSPEFAASFRVAGNDVHLGLSVHGGSGALLVVPRTAMDSLLNLAEQAFAGDYPVAPRSLLDRVLRRLPGVRPLSIELSPTLFADIEPIPIGATLRFFADALPSVTAEIDLPQDALRKFIEAGRLFMACVTIAEQKAESDQLQIARHIAMSRLSRRPPDPLLN